MRTHDEEPLGAPHLRRRDEQQSEVIDASVAHGSVAGRRTDALGAGSIQHLQRLAGNRSVGAMLEEERSPVLDVVGSGGGAALDSHTRADMEGAFGHDFGDVRVHTGGEASKSAASVQASAYTVGHDVVFQGGNYDPGSDSGKRTLAHELTHVVQQREGAVDGTPQAGGISVSDPSDRFEQAAEQNADRVMSQSRSEAPTATGVQREAEGPGAGPAVVQREDDEENEPDAE